MSENQHGAAFWAEVNDFELIDQNPDQKPLLDRKSKNINNDVIYGHTHRP
jgi:hypothetical protein